MRDSPHARGSQWFKRKYKTYNCFCWSQSLSRKVIAMLLFNKTSLTLYSITSAKVFAFQNNVCELANWMRTQNGLLINKSSRSISKHLLWNKYRYWLSKLQKIKLISQTYNSWWNSDEDTKRARWRPHTVLIKSFLTCLLPEKPKRRTILMGTKSPQTMIWNNLYQSKEEFLILKL